MSIKDFHCLRKMIGVPGSTEVKAICENWEMFAKELGGLHGRQENFVRASMYS